MVRGDYGMKDGGSAGDGWKVSGKKGGEKASYKETSNPNSSVKKLKQVKGKE